MAIAKETSDRKNNDKDKDNAGFFFLGNQLALDFLNTRPLLNGEYVELLPDFKALLRWFRAAGLLTTGQADDLRQRWEGSGRARATVSSIRQLRETLRHAVLAWESGKALPSALVAELNRLMSERPMRTRILRPMRKEIMQDGGHATTELWFEASQPEDLFSPLAHSAAMLFANADRSRVRKCANCVVHFLDISKKGTRRWCSMQFCGNRHKVAAYAARRRSENRKADANIADAAAQRLICVNQSDQCYQR